MKMRRLAEYARLAEQGRPAEAARACLAEATDADERLLEATMKYGLVSCADVEDFHDAHGKAYCIRLDCSGEEFWLAPLDAWDSLPAGVTIMSPRGLKALGQGLADEVLR